MDINLTQAIYGVMAFTVVWLIAAYWVGYWQGRWRERDNHKRAGQHADDTLFQLIKKLQQMQHWDEPAAFRGAVEIALDTIEEFSKDEISPHTDNYPLSDVNPGPAS